MTKVALSFSVDTEDDRDILQFLDRVPQGRRSMEFRRVFKSALCPVTLGAIYQKLTDIERLLRAGAVATGHADADAESADPRAARAASKIADLGL